MLRLIVNIFFIILFARHGVAKNFSSCSEKWFHEIKVSKEQRLPGTIFSMTLPPAGIHFIVLDTLEFRQKSKVAHLFKSAGIVHRLRHNPHLIQLKHTGRVNKFYNKYISPYGIGTLKLYEVIRTLALYDRIAWKKNKCHIIIGRTIETPNFRKSIVAKNVFPNNVINPQIKEEIDSSIKFTKKRIKHRDENYQVMVLEDFPKIHL